MDSTNIALRYLPSETTSKRLEDEEALFNFFDISKIHDFGDIAWYCIQIKNGDKVKARPNGTA